jgi:membrane protease YdiL (CAAX protease family)
MRPIRSLAVYILVVFVGGALTAPWLYWLAQSLAQTFPHLAQNPFHRFVNRSLLILALAGLWPLLRSLGATTLRDLGLVKPSGQWKRLGAGFLFGFVSLALVAGAALLAGARTAAEDLHPGNIGPKLLGAALTAVVVSLLEEILFRGAIFGALRKAFDWITALTVSSMIYALVHFLARAEIAGPITWHSGLELLPRMLRGFGNLQEIVPGFFNLTVAGALLALAYQRTGNLFFSIGLHGGWIFWLNSYRVLTKETAGASSGFWGTYKLIDGWLALLVLAATLAAMLRLSMLKEQPLSSIAPCREPSKS